MTVGDLTSLRRYPSDQPDLVTPLADALAQTGPLERPIRSRWGHDVVPEWRRVPATEVCEVGYVSP
jgi:hypothetical protein